MRARAGALISRRQPAVALLLVMIAVIVSSTVAYSYLSAQETSIGIARNITSRSQAYYLADTARNLTIDYLNSDDNWRTNRPTGTWISNEPFGAGTYSIRCDDGIDEDGNGVIAVPAEGDGDLKNDPNDPFTLTITGSVKGCTQIIREVIRPLYVGPQVLFIVNDTAALTSAESSRKALMETWKWSVNLMNASEAQSKLLAATDTADVVYVSASATALGNKIKSATLGVVFEAAGLSSSFGLSSTFSSYTVANSNQFEIINNSNYITQNFSAGVLSFSPTGSVYVEYPSGTLAGGAVALAQRVGTTTPILYTLEVGTALYGGGTAADRRVFLPIGRYLATQLNSDGQSLIRRSLEWASGAAGISAMGYQTAFTSSQSKVNNKQISTRVTLGESGTLTSITAYLRGSSGNTFRYAIYSDTGGQPGSLLVQSAVGSMSVRRQWKWMKLSVPATTLGPGTYWLALSFNQSGLYYRYSSSGGSPAIAAITP